MPRPAESLAGLCRHYTDALLAGDARGATALVEDAAQHGVAVDELYLHVLTPALHEVGARWERGQISIADEHAATAAASTALAGLAARLGARPGPGGTALVCRTPGERHALSSRMVADFLAAGGWTVDHASGDASVEDVVARAERLGADVVALSTSLPWLLPEARRLCVALHALPEPPRVIVGGRAYRGDAGVAALVGADAFAPDPRALLALLDSASAAP